MRKILASLILILTLSVPLSALEQNLITDTQTATAVALTGTGWFYGLILKTDGTNNVTLNIYDGIGTTTKRLLPTNFVAPGTDYYFSYRPPTPIKVTTGIYVTVSVAGGGTCAYQVFYSRVRQ